jgi:hypothetical protein
MAELMELAKAQQSKVASILKVPASKPFMKGKVTLFAFNRRFDYSEFGTMVEKRELPPDSQSHWRYNIVDAYAALAIPKDEETLPLMLAEKFAGAYVESRGVMPHWFAAGSAKVVASRAEPKDPTIKQWDEAIKPALSSLRDADQFLKSGDVLDADTAALSYGFLKVLMSKMGVYQALLNDLEKEVEFEPAFIKHYGADPKTAFAAWARSATYAK